MCAAPSNPRPAGSSISKTMNAVTMPTKITAICNFCVRLTASLPPVTVYTMTRNPMKTMIRSSRQPSIVERMMAGA